VDFFVYNVDVVFASFHMVVTLQTASSLNGKLADAGTSRDSCRAQDYIYGSFYINALKYFL